MQRERDDLLETLLEFAVRVGKGVDALPDARPGRPVSGPW